MLVALTCLWIGFAAGVACAAVLAGGRRGVADLDDDAPPLGALRALAERHPPSR